ncbi:hypothetical protein A2U01_0036653, partial [Trifolium medium]|nr:hypothetical protein [Trifolium medium]
FSLSRLASPGEVLARPVSGKTANWCNLASTGELCRLARQCSSPGDAQDPRLASQELRLATARRMVLCLAV